MAVTFFLLGLAICCVWLPPVQFGKRFSMPPWPLPFALALGAGAQAGILALPALAALGLLVLFAWLATRPAAGRARRTVFTTLSALLALALAMHLVPGFRNPLLLSGAHFSPDSAPFTQYANFDKGAVGLVLLALFCRRCQSWRELGAALRLALPLALAMALVLLGAALALGYLRPDPKLPAYTATFLAINLFLTCVAEEAFFRGLLQERLAGALAGVRGGVPLAVLASGLLFGAAHAGGGPLLMALAGAAGLGYAYAYAATKRIEAPIVAHFAFNAIHFIGFTYPYAV